MSSRVTRSWWRGRGRRTLWAGQRTARWGVGQRAGGRGWGEWTGSAGGGAAGAVDYFADHQAQGIHVLLGGGVAEREATRAAGPGLVGTHGQQHVTGFGHARGARRAGGAGDPVRVEQHEQRVALAAGEGEVRVARQPVRPG